MKNLSYIINAVLAVGLIVLYVLHFSGEGTETGVKVSKVNDSINFSVAYVNADSLTANYKYVQEQGKILQARGEEMERDLQNRAQGLQNEIADFQRNYGNLTIGQAKALEEDLGKKDQNLRVFTERARQELLERELKLNQELYERVTAFLKEYSEMNGLQMILKYNQQSDVLYAGETLDITNVVIDALNQRYEAELSGEVSEADSTQNNK